MPSSFREKCKRGEIILVPFPFSDLSSAKVRPALVLVDQEFQDILVTPLSSQIEKRAYEIELKDSDYQGLPMPIPSCVRIHHFFCIHETLVIKKVSMLKPHPFERIIAIVIDYLKPKR